jgi:hypothetical protein
MIELKNGAVIVEVTYTIVGSSCGVANKTSNNGHRLDTGDTFDSEIGLVGCPRLSRVLWLTETQTLRTKLTSEVVRTELVRRDERVRDEELGPLIEQVILGGDFKSKLIAMLT